VEDVVDVYEISRNMDTRRLQLSKSKLIVIEMAWKDAKVFFSQKGLLASEQKFKNLQSQLSGHIPGNIRGIAFVGPHMYGLVDHRPENVSVLPELFV
jgi:hypothetical protein